jgi:hypothetical protein
LVKPYSPVSLQFYLKLNAKEFNSTVISSWHTHIEHIKSLEKSKKGKSKKFTKQNLQKYENKKYPIQVAVNKKKMTREINRIEIADAGTKFLTTFCRNIKIQPMEQ